MFCFDLKLRRSWFYLLFTLIPIVVDTMIMDLKIIFIVFALCHRALCGPGFVNNIHLQEINKFIIFDNVNRTIDIASQLVKINKTISIENKGDIAVIGVLFAINKKYVHCLAYIAANLNEQPKVKLRINDVQVKHHQKRFFKQIMLRDALQPGQHTILEVQTVYTHRLILLPKYQTNKKSQFVSFYDSHYLYSPYKVNIQRTQVITGSSIIKKFTARRPSIHCNNSFTFGPFRDINQFSVSAMNFQYENNALFISVARLDRVILVSHWGFIEVQELYYLEHTETHIPGPRFSEHPFLNKVVSIEIHIPREAQNIDIHNEFGNTSSQYHGPNYTKLILYPRNILTDHWNMSYLLHYSLPTRKYLFRNGNDFVFKMKLVDEIFPNMTIDEVHIKIILPEGSVEGLFYTPYIVDRLPNVIHNKFLDFIGRPVITIFKRNVVDLHVQDFELHYIFPMLFILQKPFMVICLMYSGFVTVIFFLRMERNDLQRCL